MRTLLPILALLAATLPAAAADSLREVYHPKADQPAFRCLVPADWTSEVDAGGNLQLANRDRSANFSLSLAHSPDAREALDRHLPGVLVTEVVVHAVQAVGIGGRRRTGDAPVEIGRVPDERAAQAAAQEIVELVRLERRSRDVRARDQPQGSERTPRERDGLELALCPRDAALLNSLNPAWLQSYPGLRIRTDAALAPGDCQVRSRFGLTDARQHVKLAALEHSLTGAA